MPLCEVSVLKQRGLDVSEHLESGPNLPKPSCDEGYVNEINLPIVNSRLFVPAGDVVRISCRTKSGEQQRLVRNSTHPSQSNQNCFGNFLDVVCFKISNQVAEWRILSDPRNNKLPVCVDECKENRFVTISNYLFSRLD